MTYRVVFLVTPAAPFYADRYSDDSLATFTSSENVPAAEDSSLAMMQIAYSSTLKQWVAVGANAGVGGINYSSDGIGWSTAVAVPCGAVVWSPDLAKFVVTSNSGTDTYTSTDAISWTNHAGVIATAVAAMCWGDTPALFVLVGGGVASTAYTSPDGITWTSRVIPDTTLHTYSDVAWSHSLGIFVAIANGDKFASSPDGVTWTQRSAPSSLNWIAVDWSPSLAKFVAIADDGSTAVSTDGTTWAAGTSLPNPGGVAYKGMHWDVTLSEFITVQSNDPGNTNPIYTSPDGSTWSTSSELGPNLIPALVHGVMGGTSVLTIHPKMGAYGYFGESLFLYGNVNGYGNPAFLPLSSLGAGLESLRGTGQFRNMVATGTAYGWNLATGDASFEELVALGNDVPSGSCLMLPLTGGGDTPNMAFGAPAFQPLVIWSQDGFARFEVIGGTGFGFAQLQAVYDTEVMNTRNYVMTQYQNWNFNSYTKIGADYYAAGPNGLYKIGSGTDDAGTPISWAFRTWQMDDGIIELKRLTEVLLGMRASGDLLVRIWMDDSNYSDYTLSTPVTDNITQRRVVPGKGMRSRYYMVEIQGIDDNTMLEMDSMQVNMVKTARRLG